MIRKIAGWTITILSLLATLYGISQVVVGLQAMGSPDVSEAVAGLMLFPIALVIILIGGVFLLSGVWLIRKD